MTIIGGRQRCHEGWACYALRRPGRHERRKPKTPGLGAGSKDDSRLPAPTLVLQQRARAYLWPHRGSRRFATVMLRLALLLGGTLLLLGEKASGRAMHPSGAAIPWGVADYPDLRPEAVTVKSRTRIPLAGRFFPGRSRATIVLSHGYGGNQDEMLPIASALHGVGFSVFTYDMRGCGHSGGAVTFGALEQEDLRSVVDAVTARPDVDPDRIGALGFSMGAATTVLEAAGDSRIKAVVDDSGWSDVRHWLRPRARDLILHPTAQFSPISLKLVELRTATRMSRLRPVGVIGRLSPRPILIIHGVADEVVPPADSELNLAAAGEPKDLWRVAGAAHGDTVRPRGATSGPRVTAFFEQALHP